MQKAAPPGSLRLVGGFICLFIGGIFTASVCMGIGAVLGGKESLTRILVDYLPFAMIFLLGGVILYGWHRWKLLISIVFVAVSGLLLTITGFMYEAKIAPDPNAKIDLETLRRGGLITSIPVLLIGLFLLILHRREKSRKTVGN